jgi:hypothetical protein
VKRITAEEADARARAGIFLAFQAPISVPGVSVAIIEDGKLASVESYGVKSFKASDKVDERTVFQAASLSKVVFAYGVLKLVDRGKLDLDTPLSKYIPEYVQKDDRINAITSRHVLTHRTGFPNWRQGGKPLPDVSAWLACSWAITASASRIRRCSSCSGAAGVAVVNGGTHGSEPHMGFGGVKQSGTGWREAGIEALDVYSEWKYVNLIADPARV